MRAFHDDWPVGLVPGGSLPVGAVTAFAGPLDEPTPDPFLPGSTAPDSDLPAIEVWGWMICDGRSLMVACYPELFAVLGYLYGGADGTFTIPDLRGTFLRGNDAGTGNDKDAATRTSPIDDTQLYAGVGSRQTDAMLTHEHTYQNVSVEVMVVEEGVSASTASGQAVSSAPTDPQGKPWETGVRPHETHPRNTAVNYLIKYTSGCGPSWARLWL